MDTEGIVIKSHECGGGVRSLRPGAPSAADDLRDILRETEALVRIARHKGSARDVKRLIPDVRASDKRVTILHDIGNPRMGSPRVELDILRSESRGVEEVILRRSLPPACDRAWTDDDRALELVEDFLNLIGC